jgi:glutamate dehydrogenase
VLEAAGPDMPFLVDSLLNECAAQGHEVKALFHPVVSLADGQMISVIQIHTSLLTPGEAGLLEAGARTLPTPIPQAMAAVSKLMKATAYRL